MPGDVTVPSTLKGHAAEIWRKAFLSAYDGTCADPEKRQVKDRDGCAAAVAWSAVKNGYRKNDQGEWVAKQADVNTGGSEVAMEATQPVEQSMAVDQAYLTRRAAREEANTADQAVIESPRGQQPAIRPDHISSVTWMRLHPSLRTVAAVLFERVCWRTYEQAVEDAIYSAWDVAPNPSRPEEFIFRRWMQHPQLGRVLERAVLVRKRSTSPWYLRSMSIGASQSLAVRTAADEVRYNGPRIILRGKPSIAPAAGKVPPEPVAAPEAPPVEPMIEGK